MGMPDHVVRLLGGLVTVHWSRGVLTVDTPAHRVIYNGKVMDVLDKAILASGDHCGLCGDHNRMKQAMCSSPSSPLQISYYTPVTEAKVLQHAVLHRASQVCFSKTMLPECAIGFMASETLVKEAGFVCLPAAAAETKDILRRVHLGRECTELTTMPVTFTTRLHLAKECRRQ